MLSGHLRRSRELQGRDGRRLHPCWWHWRCHNQRWRRHDRRDQWCCGCRRIRPQRGTGLQSGERLHVHVHGHITHPAHSHKLIIPPPLFSLTHPTIAPTPVHTPTHHSPTHRITTHPPTHQPHTYQLHTPTSPHPSRTTHHTFTSTPLRHQSLQHTTTAPSSTVNAHGPCLRRVA